MVNRYQELVDRNIDAILGEAYQVPLRAMNQVQPSGLTKRVFPGDVAWAAKYWTSGQILTAEFQQLEQNMTDQAKEFVDEAKKTVYAMTRPDHRVPGQRRRSTISRTMPPNMQPPQMPEPPV